MNDLVFVPGNIGEKLSLKRLVITKEQIIQTGNYVGFMFEEAKKRGIDKFTFFGHIGKLIKAESLIGNRLDSRTGILMDVGSDYMVIKPTKHCVTTVIDLKCVKYVSVIHDNDRSKTGWV